MNELAAFVNSYLLAISLVALGFGIALMVAPVAVLMREARERRKK
jgi:hypothetical protein